jgi:hypothetical protein
MRSASVTTCWVKVSCAKSLTVGARPPRTSRNSAALSYDLGHQPIDPVHRAHIADVAGSWNGIEDAKGAAEPNRNLLDNRIKGLADLSNIFFHFSIEEGLGGNAHRQGRGFDVHVTQVARPPTFKHTLGETDRCIAVDGEPLSVKGRRRQSTLTMPEFAFARQKALTEDLADVAKEEGKFDKVPRVLNQHMLDVVGVVEQHGWPGAQAQGHNVPIMSRPFNVIAKGITSEIEQVSEKRQPPWSGRPPAKLGTSFRMGRGRVFLLDRHVMNLNFGWKDCPFVVSRTGPLVWQAAWLTICFRVYGTPASSRGAW